ncbi:MAG TPA: NTP transferase domain-containing protein [Oligoflexus sp.]|uniref:NTP transferase domain-containing protein n=1 Tax=Oligoflexus sp. TaxID=1971216 RepID=UPI002D4EBB1F|nr:NTP transferase domain-containing protein [Oligoflexus sp.]HYX33213.1 NTP transferase domain-containing protein [Oligoflexus sp.]
MSIHLLLPMSGQGTRFQKAGYAQPKPMIEVCGVPMIERLLSVFPNHWPAVAVIADNHAGTGIKEKLQSLRPGIEILSIPPHSKGPGQALLKALEKVPPAAPVLVSYCDYGMSWDPFRFESFVQTTQCDACLVSYRGFHAHYLSPVPYAYSRMDGERVLEVKEKGWFGDDREKEFASAGTYYFKSASLLKEALAVQERLGLVLNGESYTSLTIEAVLKANRDADVRIFEIPYFYQWGTPEDLQAYEYWHRTLSSWSRFKGKTSKDFRVEQVLLPMCGLGSRFSQLTHVPKPFLKIGQRLMFEESLASLPTATHTQLVALESHRGYLSDRLNHSLLLEATPSGQALSVQAGMPLLRDSGDIIVTACDHGIVLDPEKWIRFKEDSEVDAAIFTVKGFPGGARRPQAYAWVETEGDDEFPRVTNVSVKKSLVGNPLAHNLLVGTFWFRDKAVMQKGLDRLIAKDVRVNGEIYLDSVFSELLSQGFLVRVIPLDGYVNWGDPDSLAESLYWQEVFFGHAYERRSRFPGVEVANDKV